MADTAVSGPVQAWAWQQLGATPVAGDGVARGMRLIDVRCAGVRCRVFADSAGGWVIRAEGGFPQLAGTTLRIFQADADARQTPMAERSRGVFSDGRFWDQVGTWQLPAGRYGVLYQPASGAQPVAAITFEVQRQAAAADGRDSGATTGGDAARLRAAEQARKLQRCLAMAAANPDVRCVRE